MSTVFTVRQATGSDLDEVFRLRHQVYAVELGQYPVDPTARLAEPPDSANVHILVLAGDVLAGFVSVTPPWAPRYFVERYLDDASARRLRADSPFEIRALTVRDRFRGTAVAGLLMYAALRWVTARDGAMVIAMGRVAAQGLYTRLGLRPTGEPVTTGAQRYEVMRGHGPAAEAAFADAYQRILPRLARTVRWEMDCPFEAGPRHCAHGGRSFDAIGTRFDRLDRRAAIVTADVLDAWFDPAPGVLAALTEDPGWLARSSPPALADGLVAEIAQARGVDPESVVLGAGSSDLLYRALPRLIGAGSRVLLTEPTYGEYPHLVGKLGAQVDTLELRPEDGWRLDPGRLRAALRRAYDLVVLVNPGNPTGGHIPADELWATLQSAPVGTTVWIDEAYADYVGPDATLEPRVRLAANVVVCKTMSKVYALSGLRVGYLVAPLALARRLRDWTPPWVVSLPAQIAAVRAVRDPGYYARCWQRTATLREDLVAALDRIDGLRVSPSLANFVLVRLPQPGTAAEVRRRCEDQGVFIRDVSPLSANFGDRYVRIAVKDQELASRVVAAVGTAVAGG